MRPLFLPAWIPLGDTRSLMDFRQESDLPAQIVQEFRAQTSIDLPLCFPRTSRVPCGRSRASLFERHVGTNCSTDILGRGLGHLGPKFHLSSVL
jgi:hypothetical protein